MSSVSNTPISELVKHAEQVIKHLLDVCPEIKKIATDPESVIYGSFLSRVITRVEKDKDRGSEDYHANVLLTVLWELSKDAADIDMFVGKDLCLETFSQVEPDHDEDNRKYQWLAYRFEKSVADSCRQELTDAILKCRTLGEMRCVSDRIACDARIKMSPIVHSWTIWSDIYERKTLLQIHKSKKENPTELLNKVYAPFITVESLMWTFENGITTRFGVNLETAVSHILAREIRLVNPLELSEFLDENLYDSSEMFSLKNRLELRLLKYGQYGYHLALTEEDLQCKTIAVLIDSLMLKHVGSRNQAQKNKIAIGEFKCTDTNGVFVSEFDSAIVVQELHNQYIACVAGAAAGVVESGSCEIPVLPSEICDIIGMFAARSNESVYHEDPQWREEVDQQKKYIASAEQQVSECQDRVYYLKTIVDARQEELKNAIAVQENLPKEERDELLKLRNDASKLKELVSYTESQYVTRHDEYGRLADRKVEMEIEVEAGAEADVVAELEWKENYDAAETRYNETYNKLTALHQEYNAVCNALSEFDKDIERARTDLAEIERRFENASWALQYETERLDSLRNELADLYEM